MCGFFGLLGPQPDHLTLEKMQPFLAHRGPDDFGIYRDENISLSACRLSIVDLAGGHQPLSNENGDIWIAYNGETFNSDDLRKELKQAGHRFRTNTDTEVLVHAYEQWGSGMIARLRGMFAFAIWDAVEGRLLLARDRFGIKPLYYLQSATQFAFASEILPLFQAFPKMERRADKESLLRLFTLGFVPAPFSLFQGIKSLPAAHYLVIQDNKLRQSRYWQLTFPQKGRHEHIPFVQAAAQFKDNLQDAVKAWSQSDVPVGCLLSGGIDSASLSFLLTEITGSPIHTFTIGFSGRTCDETLHARETSRIIGSNHHEVNFSQQDFSYLREVVSHLEQPQCSATSVPIFLLYKICREAGYKVVLTGEGSDELLGGYHWYKGDRLIRPLMILPVWLRRLFTPLLASASEASQRVLSDGTTDPVQRYQVWQCIGRSRQRAQLIPHAPDLASPWWNDSPFGLLEKRSVFDQFLFMDAHTRLVDFINFEVDRMSMTHSVEARTPFLDHKLWEFTAKLPPRYKLGLRTDKRLLRQGLKGMLPNSLLQRPKRGLSSPHAEWWRTAKMPTWVEDHFQPQALEETGYFDPQEVLRLRKLHSEGKTNAAPLLTGVLTTQIWHELFIKAG